MTWEGYQANRRALTAVMSHTDGTFLHLQSIVT